MTTITPQLVPDQPVGNPLVPILESLTVAVSTANQTIAMLDGDVRRAVRNKETAVKTLRAIRQDNRELRAKVVELEPLGDRDTRVEDELRQKLAELEAEMEATAKQANEREEAARRLVEASREQIDDYRKRMMAAETGWKKADERTDKATADLAKANMLLKKKSAASEGSSEEMTKLRDQLDFNVKARSKANRLLEDTKTDLEKARAEAEETKKQLAAAESRAEEAEARLAATLEDVPVTDPHKAPQLEAYLKRAEKFFEDDPDKSARAIKLALDLLQKQTGEGEQ